MTDEIDITRDESEDRITLLSLSPAKLEADELIAYDQEFSFAFGNDDIKNIAISGPYGAGKNTVMESWERQHGADHSFLHVQLAHFKDETGHGGEQDLEVEILNQLIHKTDPKLTPKSRFKRTRDGSPVKDVLLATALLAFALLSIYLGWGLSRPAYPGPFVLPTGRAAFGIACGLWVAEAVAGMTWLIRTSFLSRTLKKLKLFSAELEVADDKGASAFDRSMDDLLYLLNGSGSDVVVFEDLDRFGQVGIFEKLHSINSLANASRRPGAKVLRFVYLVHDGLFRDSHDRAKFFDFIIPVIPYADTSNAYDLLKSGLKGVGVEPDDRFLRGLSVFVDDPRILNAIVDGTYHYKRVLQRSQGGSLDSRDAKHLVSAIAFKETFPKDFERLQVGRGYMHALLSGRERLIADELRSIEEQRSELEDALERSEDEVARSERELVLLYQTTQIAEMFVISGYYSPQITRFENPDDLMAAIDGDQEKKEKFDDIRAALDGNPDFLRRLDDVKARREGERRRIESSIRVLDKRRAELRRAPLRELFAKEECYLLEPEDLPRPADYGELDFDDVKRSPYFGLIPFLISTGGIDESYERYTSNFYPTSLTREDRNFVTAVLGGRSDVDPDYILGAPKAVVLCMDEACLPRKCARNRSLLKALIETGEPSQTAAFLSGVEMDCDTEFLLGYMASDQCTPKAFPAMREGAMRTIEAMLESRDPADAYAKRIMMHRLLAEGGSLRDDPRVVALIKLAAESDPEFLTAGKSRAGQVADGLEAIGYSAEDIVFDGSDANLVEEVYARRLFVPNAALVAGFLGHFGASDEATGFDRLVDSVNSSGAVPDPEPFKEFVRDGMECFISSLVAGFDGEIDASEEAVCWVMNADGLSNESASSFAARLSGRPVSDASLVVSVDKRSALFAHDRVVASSDNIFGYYIACGSEVSEVLVGFLERNDPPADLGLRKSKEVLGAEGDFLEDLMKSDMAAAPFEKIANGYGAVYPDFNITDIGVDKVGALITIGAIPLTAPNLQFIREEHGTLAVRLASSDADAYVDLVIGDEGGAALPFKEAEALEIFESPGFPESSKVRLLGGFSSPVKLVDGYPPSLLAAIIRGTNFSPDDLSALPGLFESGEPDLRHAVLARASSSYREMMSARVNIPWTMVADMTKAVAVEHGREAALALISWQLEMSTLTEKRAVRRDLGKCFSSAGQDEYVKLLEGSQVQIPDTQADRTMVDSLERFGLCTMRKQKLSNSGKMIVYPKGYTGHPGRKRG